MENLFKSLYKVSNDDKRALEKYWVYSELYFQSHETTLVAKRSFDSQEDNTLKHVEFYISAFPARFLECICYMGDNRILRISTGSGSVSEYIDKIMPILEEMGNDMINIEISKKGVDI